MNLDARAIARAVDAKDGYTHDHSIRVGDLAARLAEACGWSGGDVERIREAGFVHDVGKLSLSATLLKKTGQLTHQERRLVAHHPRLAADMLIRIEAFDVEQIEWVLHHHERPDARGYPDALRHDQITPGAAILALSDAFDSMTSTRSYQAALPIRDALAHVDDLCNRQFCHAAVCLLDGVYG